MDAERAYFNRKYARSTPGLVTTEYVGKLCPKPSRLMKAELWHISNLNQICRGI